MSACESPPRRPMHAARYVRLMSFVEASSTFAKELGRGVLARRGLRLQRSVRVPA